MENYSSANFRSMEDPCPGYTFKLHECNLCGRMSQEVTSSESGPTCLPCYTAHTAVPLVTANTRLSSGENNLFTESNSSVSDGWIEEDSSNRLVIDESGTESAMENNLFTESNSSVSDGWIEEDSSNRLVIGESATESAMENNLFTESNSSVSDGWIEEDSSNRLVIDESATESAMENNLFTESNSSVSDGWIEKDSSNRLVIDESATESAMENNLFTESNSSVSDGWIEEDSSNRLVIDESATESAMEWGEEFSADAIDSSGCLGEPEDFETDGSTDIDSLEMVSSGNEELVDDRVCLEGKPSEEHKREDPEDDNDYLEASSVSKTSGSQDVNEKYKLSSDTDTLRSQKRNRSNAVSENEEKASKKMKSSESSFEKDVSPAFDRVPEDDLIGKDNDIIGIEVSIPHSPTENQEDWYNAGVYNFANQEKNAIIEGAFVDKISINHDDVSNERLNSQTSSSDEGFVSLPRSSHLRDRLSPDFHSVLLDSAASICHGSDAESMEEERSSGFHTDTGVDGDVSSSDAESDSYGSCFAFTNIKFRFETRHAPQDVHDHDQSDPSMFTAQ